MTASADRASHDSGIRVQSGVAIVHDYLTQRGGAERVVLALSRAFPEAPIYTSFYNPGTTFAEFRERDVRPLPINRLAALRRRHRLGLPFLPLAFVTSHVDAKLVICSSSGWAHGIRTNGVKIVYCHSPAKWLYRRDDYLGANPSGAALKGVSVLDPYLRRFDQRAAASADVYIANSTFIAAQIQKVYGREAEVVFPPAGLGPDGPQKAVADLEPGFILAVARLLPYKNVAQIVEAFRGLGEASLVVVGDGPERDTIVAGAPRNVRFLGEVTDASLRWLYANCAALVTASREDFGLTPVEAASFGKPTAALRWGGFLDTVVPSITGYFFDEPDPLSIARAIQRLFKHRWNRNEIRQHAARFSERRFIERMQTIAAHHGALRSKARLRERQ